MNVFSYSRNFGFEGITRQIRSQKGGKPEEGNCFKSMEATVGNLVAKIAIQEPIFDRIIVVYGQVDIHNSFTALGSSIHVVLEYLILSSGSSSS